MPEQSLGHRIGDHREERSLRWSAMAFGSFLTAQIRETFQGRVAGHRMDIEWRWCCALDKAGRRFECCGEEKINFALFILNLVLTLH